MNRREYLVVLFILLGTLVELGLLMVFIDLTMRGRATSLWSFSGWVWLIFPFLCGWMVFARRWISIAWMLLLVGAGYGLWYFLSRYGLDLFENGMLIIGVPSLIVVLALFETLRLRKHWSQLREA